MDKLNIAFVASEVDPFAKSGGLADVAGALPKALHALGHNIFVLMPRYYIIDKERYNLSLALELLVVPMGYAQEEYCAVYKGVLPDSDVPIYFLEHEKFFGRKGLYDDGSSAYLDNNERFIFLSRALFELCKALNFRPDIIHANDWHSAAATTLLKAHYGYDDFFKQSLSLLTIHNMQHQGRFSKESFEHLLIDWQHFNTFELEDFGGINLLKGGIVHADAVSTVSRKYAQEIQSETFGWGLHEVIQAHNDKLFGILNGVDYTQWGAEHDTLITKQFNAKSMKNKAVNKEALQLEFNLPVRDVPLFGVVGRFAEQKGIALLAEALEGMLQLDIQVVILGSGEFWAEKFFSDMCGQYGDKLGVFIGYNNTLAHVIEAGSDFFLMPSLFEPCGLNQIYSLAYGTIPVVRATGGLDDTIEAINEAQKSGNGIKFYDATAHALYGCVEYATALYFEKPALIKQIRLNAMSAHFSWEVAAKEYTLLYNFLIAQKSVIHLRSKGN